MIQLLLTLVLIAIAGWYFFRPTHKTGKAPASAIVRQMNDERHLGEKQAAMIEQARASAAAANEAALRTAIQSYYASAGAYPPSLDALVSGGYIQSVPQVDGYVINYDASSGAVNYAGE